MSYRCVFPDIYHILDYILLIFCLNVLFTIHMTRTEKCSYNDIDNPLRIKNILPDQYLTISPPNKSHPVYIGVEILDVNSINDAENFFSLQVYLFEVWKDMRLNTESISESESISVPDRYSSCLWTPSLVFENSTEMEKMISPNSVIIIYKNKVLIRKSRYSFKVSCHMNLQTYPMDRHLCHYTIRTFSEPVEKVTLNWIENIFSPIENLLDSIGNKSVIHKSEFTPSLFDIQIGKYDNYIKTWFSENFTILDVEFIFERTITANVLTVYIPSSLIVTLSWIQFWFDVEAVPGRMSLGIMSTLTIMTQILTNYEKAANHVTAVDIWLLVCLIMVFLALMEYAIAYTISHYYDIDGNLRAKNSFKKNMSLILRELRTNKQIIAKDKNKQNSNTDENSLFKRVADKVIAYEKKDNNFEDKVKSFPELVEVIQTMIKSFNEINSKLEAKCECNRHLNLVDYISRYVFPIFFVLFALFYWILLIHFYDSS